MNRKPILSCAHCRASKRKCDRKLPSCSTCLKAGIECHSYRRNNNDILLPRSIKKYLEGVLFRHCKDAERQGIDSTLIISAPLSKSSQCLHYNCKSIIGKTISLDGISPLPTFVFESSKLPRLDVKEIVLQSSHRQKLFTTSLALAINHIPSTVSKHLVSIYQSKVNSLFPILSGNEAVEALDRVAGGTASRYDIIMIALVFCLSATTATREFKKKALEFHIDLYLRVLKELDVIMSISLESLKILLLITVYTQMNPGFTNLEFLNGVCYRLCVDLGLHRFYSCSKDEQLKRACLLWTFLDLDIGSSVCQLKPSLLPLENVEVKISFFYHDLDFVKKNFNSLVIWQHRSFEEEIQTLHSNGLTHKSSIDLETRIYEWKDYVFTTSEENNCDPILASDIRHWASTGVDVLMVLLYRPSKENAKPLLNDVYKLLECSVNVARGYEIQQGLSYGSVKYSWMPTHHSYIAALCFVYGLRRLIFEKQSMSITKLHTDIEQFTRTFKALSEGWDKAESCISSFKKLVNPVLQNVSKNHESYTDIWSFIDTEFQLMFQQNPISTEINEFQWGDVDFNEFSEMFAP